MRHRVYAGSFRTAPGPGTPPRKQFCAIAVFGPELAHASVASVVFCCLVHVEDTSGLKDIGAAGLWGISALFTLFL